METATLRHGAKRRLLILGGTAEAAALARTAADRYGPGLEMITSLAGRLPTRPSLPGMLRVGPFGGIDGLADFLKDERIDVLVDATHPFAATISRNAADAAARASVPRLQLLRPQWRPTDGDRWLSVADLSAAAAALPGLAQRVFLASGTGGIEAFAACQDVWFLVRSFAAPPTPLPFASHTLVVARPPFPVEDEIRLMRDHRIEALVSKNSGGATEGKLTAARALGLPVVMVERPVPPEGPKVATVEDALAWLDQTLR